MFGNRPSRLVSNVKTSFYLKFYLFYFILFELRWKMLKTCFYSGLYVFIKYSWIKLLRMSNSPDD